MEDLIEMIKMVFFGISFQAERTIGAEKELQLARQSDLSVGDVFEVFDYLEHNLPENWEVMREAVDDSVKGFEHPELGQIIYDGGEAHLEWVSEPYSDLHDLNDAYEEIMEILLEAANANGQVIMGVGMHPWADSRRDRWIDCPRYNILADRFGSPIHPATLSASNQTHVAAVSAEDMLHLSSAFNAISGLITAITANAPFKNGLHKGCLAERQQMWIDFSPTRTGQPPGWWRDWDNYAEWVLRKEYILGPNQEGGMMKHGKPFWAFCAEKFQERGCLDLEFFEKHLLPHVSCLWQDARQRAAYGTVEVRPACQQPPGMGIAHDALILGLASNKERFLEFACQLDWQAWQAVKRSALLQGRKGQVDGIDIWAMAFKLVRIAYDGLEIRGLEESQYLEPYFSDLGRSWKTHAERQLDLTKDWPEHEEKFREEFIY